jgi:glucose/mannose-6-phosphate isomerase
MTKAERIYLKSIELLEEQIKQAYQESKKIKLPKSYNQVNKVVTCGMGGSQLGVDLVRHLFRQEIKVPIIQVKGYNLPKFIDSRSLVFLISYSGNTEEVITIANNVKKQKAKVVVISSNGKLAKLAQKQNIPAYIFDPINNPSGQPRLGTGYMIGSFLVILKKLRLIGLTDSDFKEIVKVQNLKLEAQDYSKKLKDKIPVIITSEFLQGNAHIIANQINEAAKQLALYYSIPELNHHLLEGLTFPKINEKNLYFVFFYSQDYHQRNQMRYKITQKILTKQKIPFVQIKFTGGKVSQSMKMLKFGSLLSFYLSIINKVDPNRIPWVNFFKKQLSKSS